MNAILEAEGQAGKVNILTEAFIAEAIKNGVTYSHQVGGVVIHGAIREILKGHYRTLDRMDSQFNHLVAVCNILAKAACKHDLHVMNAWCDKFTKDDSTIDWRKVIGERGEASKIACDNLSYENANRGIEQTQ